MFRKFYNIAALFCGLSALMTTGCSSSDDEPGGKSSGPIAVTLEARSPRTEDGSDKLHADLNINAGFVLVYDKDGNYETGDRFDPATQQVALYMEPGEKRIVAVINANDGFRAKIATYCNEPVLDEFGNPVLYRGKPVIRHVKPGYETYAELAASVKLDGDCLNGVQDSRSMVLIHDKTVTVADNEDKTDTIDLPLSAPIARVDLHARCLPAEKSRVVDAAIRVAHASPLLNWDFTRPAEETEVVAKFTDISDKMTAVTEEDELFGDWVVENVKEDTPLATLYTYHTDTNARLEVGLRFKGSADYDWYPLDMPELMKPDIFKGLEAGHLYQIFITVYPDKVGHIIVDPWIIPTSLDFTIG